MRARRDLIHFAVSELKNVTRTKGFRKSNKLLPGILLTEGIMCPSSGCHSGVPGTAASCVQCMHITPGEYQRLGQAPFLRVFLLGTSIQLLAGQPHTHDLGFIALMLPHPCHT